MADLKVDESVGSLADRAHHELHRLITIGELNPGQPLSERTLCEALGMSRTPVREALLRLTAEGLLVAEPNRGVRIREFTAEDLVGLAIVREALEGQAARYAARRVTDEELGELYALCDAIGEIPTDDPGEYVFRSRELDVQFHERIVELSGIPALIDFYRRQHLAARQIMGWNVTRLPGNRTDPTDAEGRTGAGHRALVDALATRDPATVEAVIRRQTQEGITRTLSDVNRLHLGAAARV